MCSVALRSIDGKLFRQMILTATAALDANKDAVNALNVFPVPDGDTGSNMSLTMLSAAREVQNAGERAGLGALAHAVAQGSLMGARGNSGVILSQLFRGFARASDGIGEADAREIARALEEGVDTAYKAVMKPVEGTILTVAREAARAASQAARHGDDVGGTLLAAHKAAHEALERTPDLLPVLKKAGVVDSGGKGYCVILDGYLQALGLVREAPNGVASRPVAPVVPPGRDQSPAGQVAFKLDAEIADIRFPYDCEFFIRGEQIDVAGVRTKLEDGLGDCVIVVGTPQLVKVHIHTDNPGPVLDHCVQQGDLLNIEIKNMKEQHADLVARAVEQPAAAAQAEAVDEVMPGNASVVAVAAGAGLEAIFRSLGAEAVVTGGQTMNPSTQDILAAAEHCASPVVFVLPNNKNVILAAQQAATLSAKDLRVIPSRSVPEGISALVAFHPEAEPDRAEGAMRRAVNSVQTGEVTYAVRDTHFGDLEIHEGDILGLWGGQVKLTGAAPDEVVQALLAEMMEDVGGEVITLYWGEGVTSQQAESLTNLLHEQYPDCEIEVQYGGQPLYFYLFSLE